MMIDEASKQGAAEELFTFNKFFRGGWFKKLYLEYCNPNAYSCRCLDYSIDLILSFIKLNRMATLPFFDSEVLANSGEFLCVEHAANYLQNFYSAEESSVLGDVKDTIISGQVITLTLLEEFIGEIRSYNNRSPNEEKIVAIRIYSALSNRRKSMTLPKETRKYMPDKDIRDIILEPVKADGRDLHNLQNPSGGMDKLILGMALPCPNVCPKDFEC